MKPLPHAYQVRGIGGPSGAAVQACFPLDPVRVPRPLTVAEASPLPYDESLTDLPGGLGEGRERAPRGRPEHRLGRSGYDPIQEADAFPCPMAEAAAEDAREEP